MLKQLDSHLCQTFAPERRTPGQFINGQFHYLSKACCRPLPLLYGLFQEAASAAATGEGGGQKIV